MPEVGKILIFGGLLIACVGLGLMYLPKGSNPFAWFGRLPGDIYYNSGTVVVWIPITTMIIIGICVRLGMWIFASLFQK